ncbi:MAG: hypothetical protein HZB98_01090 [Bacteroidia bacterium]|nr:hypothetical protein [Bacteroidia bacterium]
MKSILKTTALILFAGILFAGCERTDSGLETAGLKLAIDQGAADLNAAMKTISTSKAFTLFTVTEEGAKSDLSESEYDVYISLDQIKGVYEYSPAATTDRWGIPLIRFFSRTADDAKMIVKLPLKKVEHPKSLRSYIAADTALTNNFSISVSEYHNNYNNFHDYDYILSSDISIDDAAAGKLNIESIVSPDNGIDYKSEYVFTENYNAKYRYLSGDTTVSSFGIYNGTTLLYEEKRQTIPNDTARFGREHLYTLTIGNVQIVRKSGVIAPAIYVDGVLQTSAVVEIIDRESDPEATVCKKRAIRILFDSLHDVYFAAYIVDWIAYDIYYER